MPGVTWSGLSRPTYNLIGKTSSGIPCFIVRDTVDDTWAVVVNKLPLKTGVRSREAAMRICERVVTDYGLSQSNPRRRNPTWDQLHGADHEAFLAHLNKGASQQWFKQERKAIAGPRRKAKKRRNPSVDLAVQQAIRDATAILGRRPRMGRSRK